PRARARRGRRVARARRGRALVGAHPASHARRRARPPREELDRRIVERTHAMFEAGVQEEVRAALAGPISATARKTLGLDEVATLPRGEAIEAIVARTRRYAAYQRKWMRRIPGLVIVEDADDVVALARARERVPRRGG